jgi:predicted SprT family Zn-dependent metalloprotease
VIQLELPLAPAPPRGRAAPSRRAPSARRPEALARLALALAVRLGARRRTRGLVVVFNPRLRTAAGRADSRARTIELNPRLLDRHPEELVPTLVHELCHLIAGVRTGHGERWREAMGRLGFPAVACHRLDTSGLAVRRRSWLWSCAGCGETWRRGHRSAHRYRCGRCGRRLRVAGDAPDGAGG